VRKVHQKASLKKRSLQFGLGVGLYLAIRLLYSLFTSPPAEDIPTGVYEEATEVLELRKHVAFQDAVKRELERTSTSNTSIAARFVAARLYSHGLCRLSDDQLLVWNRLRLRLFEISDDLCASAWLGGLDISALWTGLDELNPDERKEWSKLMVAAALAELNASTPPTRPSRAHHDRVLQHLANDAGTEDRQLLRQFKSAHPPKETTAACTMTKLFFGDLLSLPREDQVGMLRFTSYRLHETTP